eukprot:TRINITY_DN24130_c0_g1_i1.p3 TRINITY_DN24130_c0_g1~~TRINITY_DN24130_c0_g1_i1.p3  ORF type:complete len:203 (-),score=0.44 TRINITY_DN24130_c0_g1_i1:1590-2198(-)
MMKMGVNFSTQVPDLFFFVICILYQFNLILNNFNFFKYNYYQKVNIQFIDLIRILLYQIFNCIFYIKKYNFKFHIFWVYYCQKNIIIYNYYYLKLLGVVSTYDIYDKVIKYLFQYFMLIIVSFRFYNWLVGLSASFVLGVYLFKQNIKNQTNKLINTFYIICKQINQQINEQINKQSYLLIWENFFGQEIVHLIHFAQKIYK